jgi:Glycosyl transferase family 2
MYNVAPFVRAAADSVLSQSWTDLELIVLDDGSTDAGLREIERIHDPRLLLLRQEHKGAAAARNTGLRRARGDYIAFMDADDVWLAGKLEQDVAYLDAHADAALVFSAMRMVDETGRDVGRTIRRWSGVLTLRDLLIENRIGADTVLIRKEVCQQAGDFDEELPAGSDYDYWLRVALLRPNTLHGSPRVTALYRRRPGQLTGDWEQQLSVWRRTMTKMRTVNQVENLGAASFHRALAASAYERGDLTAAVRLFREAMHTAPGFLLRDRRTWLLGSALLSARVLPAAAHRVLEACATGVMSLLPTRRPRRSARTPANARLQRFDNHKLLKLSIARQKHAPPSSSRTPPDSCDTSCRPSETQRTGSRISADQARPARCVGRAEPRA